MSWLTILWFVIQYGPTIYKLVKEIIDLIEQISIRLPQSYAAEFNVTRKDQLDLALAYYKRTKDRSRLEEMHGELTVQLENIESKRYAP